MKNIKYISSIYENITNEEDPHSLIRIQSYKEFLKRKILVIHMKTDDLNIESHLKILNVPFISLSYTDPDLIKKINNEDYFGIIISGSKRSDPELLPGIPEEILKSKFPKLGICYGAEVIAQYLGSSIKKQKKMDTEHSPVIAKLEKSPLFDGLDLDDNFIITMNHNNIFDCPRGCKIIASTKKTPVAAFEKIKDKIFAIQFHPEKGILGNLVFRNFFNICKKNGQ